jgi:hypothetical protein
MANQQKLGKTLEELHTLVARLKAGDLQLNELESLVLNARELYELSLVLRYKAYEGQVQGTVAESHHVEIVPQAAQDVEETKVSAPEPKPSEEVIQPAIDFSMFDEPVEMPSLEKEVQIEEEEYQEPVTENETEFVMEQPQVEPLERPEIIAEVEVPVVESIIVTEEWVSEQAPVSESDDFVKRFSAIDPSIQHQLAMSRLETLIGSFGLNERLQFINELFDGSSEAFSDAIKSIDAQSDEQSALRKASNLAAQFNWDHDSETVEEFVLKIKRRYA